MSDIKVEDTNAQFMQFVTLEFSDGTKGTFSGPAVVFDTEKTVTKISFTEPCELPADCSWGKI